MHLASASPRQNAAVTSLEATDDASLYLRRVIVVGNGKGGVLKTSTTANLAGLAASGGYRVLAIDLDPQGNLAEDLGLHDTTDGGAGMVQALLPGGTLTPTLTGVRPNLDVITGGRHLDDLTAMLMARNLRSAEPPGRLLADRLGRLLLNADPSYDLVFVDTPPGEPTLQMLALGAAKWLLIPTKADVASLAGMGTIAERLMDARRYNSNVELLGVVLCDVPSAAKRVRADTEPRIRDMLGDVAPLFQTVIRNSVSAYRTREQGVLVHELAGQTVSGAAVFAALRAGKRPPASTGTAPGLAEDYEALAAEVLAQIDHNERMAGVTA